MLDKTKLACGRIVKYCRELQLYEPINAKRIIGTYLSGGLDTSALEGYLRMEGVQWEKVKIEYTKIPARVECNACGTHYNSQEDWSPCPNCSFPEGANVSPVPLHIRLREIQHESGRIVKAKGNVIVL